MLNWLRYTSKATQREEKVQGPFEETCTHKGGGRKERFIGQ